jgi:hypothetical protein
LCSFGSAQFIDKKSRRAQPSSIGIAAKVEGSGVNVSACVGVFDLYVHAADQCADLVEIAEHDEIRPCPPRQIEFATVAGAQELAGKNRVEVGAPKLAVGDRINFGVGDLLRDGVAYEQQTPGVLSAVIDRLAGGVEDFEVEHEQALLGLCARGMRRGNRQGRDERREPNNPSDHCALSNDLAADGSQCSARDTQAARIASAAAPRNPMVVMLKLRPAWNGKWGSGIDAGSILGCSARKTNANGLKKAPKQLAPMIHHGGTIEYCPKQQREKEQELRHHEVVDMCSDEIGALEYKAG